MMNKEKIFEEAKALIGESFMRFDAKEDDPTACSVGVYEDIETSKWKGEWTETIRKIVTDNSGASCVCVKPLPFCDRKVVWYRVNVG